MVDDKEKLSEILPKETDVPSTALTVNTDDLKKESLEIINKIIAEEDQEKTKDLTYLFNINQNKKTMVRVNKLNDLLDVITNQAVTRFTTKPDEISNKELIDSLKTVQDLVERGQNQVIGTNEQQPLIQINQQDNSVNVTNGETLSRDSREKVKNAVLSLLKGIDTGQPAANEPIEAEIVEQEKEDTLDGE